MIRVVRGAHAAHPAVRDLVGRGPDRDPKIEATVRAILSQVREGGLKAAERLARKHDGLGARQSLRLSADELAETAARCPTEVQEAIHRSIAQVTAFHLHQVEESWVSRGGSGHWLGLRVAPLSRVGLYVPGGAGAYPSTVIMNAVPARVAGVEDLVVTTPCPRGLNPALAYALQSLGIDEIWRIGGAQAVGLMAYGDAQFPRVDKIVGPCNVYASIAKREVIGLCGIDNIAGPSEILCLFDGSVDPEWVAADLLSQAEHGSGWEAAIGVTTDAAAAKAVAAAVKRQVVASPRREILEKALALYGAIFVAEDWDDALAIANLLAPEHAEILTANPDFLVDGIRNAGAVFVGPWSAESAGDYVSGANHVLPTSGTARFASPLGVWDFVKRTSVIHYDRESLLRDGPHIVALAEAEGFFHHAEAVRIRLRGLEAVAPAASSKGAARKADGASRAGASSVSKAGDAQAAEARRGKSAKPAATAKPGAKTPKRPAPRSAATPKPAAKRSATAAPAPKAPAAKSAAAGKRGPRKGRT